MKFLVSKNQAWHLKENHFTSNLFNDIVLGAENDIRGALSTLNRYTNRSIGASLGEGELSEDEKKEVKVGLESIGAL